MTTKPKNMFPYAGGKHTIINALNIVFNGVIFDNFYDLFGGSGTIIMSGNIPCEKKMINDLEKNIAILYYAFKDYITMLKVSDKLEKTRLTKETFDTARQSWIEYEDNDKCSLEELLINDNERFVDLAAYAYMLHICFYCGVIKRQNVTITEKLLDKYDKYVQLRRIESYHKALADVDVHNEDAVSIINRLAQNPNYDRTSMLYCDVPYLSSNKSTIKTSATYKCSMSDEQHIALFEAANRLPKSNYLVAISNYSNDLYDGLAKANGWHKIFLAERAVSSGIAKGSSQRARECEYLYCNFKFENGTIDMEF